MKRDITVAGEGARELLRRRLSKVEIQELYPKVADAWDEDSLTFDHPDCWPRIDAALAKAHGEAVRDCTPRELLDAFFAANLAVQWLSGWEIERHPQQSNIYIDSDKQAIEIISERFDVPIPGRRPSPVPLNRVDNAWLNDRVGKEFMYKDASGREIQVTIKDYAISGVTGEPISVRVQVEGGEDFKITTVQHFRDHYASRIPRD